MTVSPGIGRPVTATGRLVAITAAPATLLFLSSNIVNAGNLAFNVIFSRLLGPEAFGALAFLLTIKLALLGVLGAFQMALTEHVAAVPASPHLRLRRSLQDVNRTLFLAACVLLVPTAGILVHYNDELRGFGLPGTHLLLILLMALPFGASLSVLRGLAFGRMDVGRIVASAQVEMVFRLTGAIAAWALGYGLEGIVCAISLSIVLGWLLLADLLPTPRTMSVGPGLLKTLSLGALPFALLQLGQVLALDGDIFLAKAVLDEGNAGHIAALSLFQRIQFFSCFALASILLPSVVIASLTGGSIANALVPVASLFALVSLPILVLAALWPRELLGLLVGAEYATAAPALFPAALAAVLFTGSYLMATLLAAFRDRRGIWIVFAVAVLQLSLMWLLQPSDLYALVEIKLACQAAAAAALLVLSFSRIRRARRV